MIKKYKKIILKYICTFVCSLLLFPLLSLNSYAAYDSYPQYVYTLPFAPSVHYANNGTASARRDFVRGDDRNYHLTHSGTIWDTAFEFMLYLPETTETDYIYSFPVNTNIYDYYVFHSFSIDNINNPTVINGYDFGYYDSSGNFVVNNVCVDRIDKELLYTSSVSGEHSKTRSYQYTAKLNLDFVGVYSLGVLRYYGSGELYGNDTYLWNLCVIALPKGDTDAYNDIVTAINNQTDIIENGNSGTQSSIDDFNQVFEDFNQELENWEQFDDEIIGEFNSANDNYMAELDNFSLSGSLLNAGNWLSTSMQTVYDNSSDYKMLWLVPLLFGIPILLFIIRKNGDDE